MNRDPDQDTAATNSDAQKEQWTSQVSIGSEGRPTHHVDDQRRSSDKSEDQDGTQTDFQYGSGNRGQSNERGVHFSESLL